MPTGIYKRTEGHRRKLSEANKGKRFPEEQKRKMREAQRGEKNPNWRGGIWKELYPTYWTDDLKESIRKRDNYICQMEGCGVHQDELERRLDVHHIDYDKDNLDPKNLISLCINCHGKTNFNRDYWENYFRGRQIVEA